jgi:AraC family transcriptional regulator
MLNIHLPSESIEQVAEASEIDPKRIDFVNCFAQQDLQLHQVAMLLFAELQSDSIIGRLYVESLTQALAIHLLRHYSTLTRTVTSQSRSLTHTQLQQAIDYIHTHLNRDLSLAELASVINISPTYFASLFKQATGTSPHQYVIQQRVERAKVMLRRTDLAIADIAIQVGFSSQSHLTQQFKRVTGLTPKQVRPSP